MAFLPTMVPCPGAITIASSAQKETICSTSRPAAAAEAHIASILSSSARALSISRLSLIVHFPLESQLQGTLISCVPENLDQALRGDRVIFIICSKEKIQNIGSSKGSES